MKKISDTQLLYIGSIIALGFIIAFVLRTFTPWSTKLEDWADTATYLGLSMSIVSIFLIYITYRSQINMSAVLQFESTFFQWHQIHIDLYHDLRKKINKFANNEVLEFIKSKPEFNINDFQAQKETQLYREVIRYYRSLYSMMKYIYLSDVLKTYETKKKYYDIIQSRMTDNELLVILYFLLNDKNLESTRVLSITYKDLLDEAHFFKNLYYSKENENFENLVLFIRALFPKTANKSFHFMVLGNRFKNQKINHIYKKWRCNESNFYSYFICFILLLTLFLGLLTETIYSNNGKIPFFTVPFIIAILFALPFVYKVKTFEYKRDNSQTNYAKTNKHYLNVYVRYIIPIFFTTILLTILMYLIP